MRLPDCITGDWMDSLTDDSLLIAELTLYKTFSELEREQKELLGAKYDMMRGPAELMRAWDRWSRVNNETRSRRLHPHRERGR
jgi:hypothetical protein